VKKNFGQSGVVASRGNFDMAEKKRQRAKLHRTLSENLIPESGTYGDVWIALDQNSIWFCARNSQVFCINDLLDGTIAHTPPRHGVDGKDSTVAGPKGDSVKGDKGDTVVGPKGDKGDPGDITVIGDSELLAAVNVLKAKQAQFLAALQIQFERNAGRQHSGLQKAIANVLSTVKADAGL
jgi:hypothetical protein